jgi:indole-3-glycerol phosphate synthase
MVPAAPSFAGALARGGRVAVIAEVKRRSPSRGSINEDLDARDRARLYVESGATCISVLTEPAEFGGSPDDLAAIAADATVPLLKKDFHVDEAQVLEARSLGASALLLIARALDPARLARLAALARDLGVEPVIEVRTERELDAALETDAPMIGVNARDLETLEIDPSVVLKLTPLIPGSRLAIAESGITTRSDVERVAAAGASAVLIGSALSAAADPRALLSDLSSVARARRGA